MAKNEFSKWFKVSALEEQELGLSKVMDLIHMVKEVNVDNTSVFEIFWLNHHFRDDNIVDHNTADVFDHKKNQGYYLLPSLVR